MPTLATTEHGELGRIGLDGWARPRQLSVIKVRHSLPARRPIFFAFPGGPPWVRNKAIFLGYFR